MNTSESTAVRSAAWLSLTDRIEYYHLSGVVLAGTFALMTLGSYTSAIGAGLSCPDWPTCYGSWIPFLHPGIVSESPYTALQIFAEWAHRGLAMFVGIGILLTAVVAYRRRNHPIVRWPAITALALLPLQVLLGGLTVTEALEPLIVTSHLAVAMVIVLSLCTTTVAAYLLDASGRDRLFR